MEGGFSVKSILPLNVPFSTVSTKVISKVFLFTNPTTYSVALLTLDPNLSNPVPLIVIYEIVPLISPYSPQSNLTVLLTLTKSLSNEFITKSSPLQIPV